MIYNGQLMVGKVTLSVVYIWKDGKTSVVQSAQEQN